MTELFRDKNFTRVGYFQSVLESEGIQTHVRDLPEMHPALCVVHDADRGRALELLRKRAKENEAGADAEITCPTCKALNPGNFEICWSCENSISR